MRRRTVETKKNRYTVSECSICNIEEYIGTDISYCDAHYSAPDVEYNYFYEYKIVRAFGYSCGYYIGIDRFYEENGTWKKEYMLYEYAVFDGPKKKEINTVLYNHLIANAKELGCSRVLCTKEGGNSVFCSYFARKGFADRAGYFALPLLHSEMPARDAVLLPADGDRVTFEQAYFLREKGFSVDEQTIRYAFNGEEICICRRTGVCEFSKLFKVVGKRDFVLDGQRALSLLDICYELLQMGEKREVNLYLPEEKTGQYAPDALIEKWGIFVLEEPLSDRRAFLAELKKAGTFDRVSLYEFQFDFEVGGKNMSLYYIDLNKR